MADYNAIIQEREPKPSIYSEEEASRREAEARHYILLANDKIKEAQIIRAFLERTSKAQPDPEKTLDLRECKVCREELLADNYTIGHVVCDRCHDKYSKKCLHCGLRQPTDRFQSFPRICDECVSIEVGKQG